MSLLIRAAGVALMNKIQSNAKMQTCSNHPSVDASNEIAASN